MTASGLTRENQRRRTREALLAAAAAMIREGKRPSVPDVAAAAGIARRTAYRYFPSPEQLHTEAALETLRPIMNRALETSPSDDVEVRVERTVREMQLLAAQNEDVLRAMIRLTIDQRTSGPDASAPRRGRRRVDWLEAALAPVREHLPRREYARLVSALTLCVGPEALIALRDIRGLSQKQAVDVSCWAAIALMRAALTNTASR